MSRRTITGFGNWERMNREFAWAVPEQFNIAEACCDSWARSDPERRAITHVAADGARRDWSYGELKAKSDALAMSLRDLGVVRGDRVAVLLAQCPEVMVVHMAVYKLGAIVLPLFTLFGTDALLYRLGDSGAKALVTDGENLGKILEIKDKLSDLEVLISTGDQKAGVMSLEALCARDASGFQPVLTPAEDPAMIIYTSGTTGSPKGVLHAHRFLIGHLPSVECHLEGFPQPGDCGWTPADWAWIGGLMDLAMPCLYFGVPLISHRMRKFNAVAAYDLIARERIRTLFLPPTALKLMRQEPVPPGVDIRAIGSGGESLGADLHAWAHDQLGATINEIYGQTECNLVVSSTAGVGVSRAGAMGKATPGHDVRIIDEAGQVVAAGTTGEIAVRRPDPVMFLEYWNKPDETTAKFVGDWLKTGDLGVEDADGYIRFVSRDDDVITSAGYRVGPTEIENCLTGHPDVLMAAVIGVPDEVRTEIIKAVVVPVDGADWETLVADLRDRVRERVSPHVVPRQFEKADSLPMTATGKIMRRALRDA